MNTLVENQLSEYEKTILVPALVAGLNKMTGKNNIFSSKQCCDKMTKLDYKINDAVFRRCVQFIRDNNMVPGLIGTPQGYYKAVNRQEVQNYLNSLYERSASIQKIILSVEKDLLTLK